MSGAVTPTEMEKIKKEVSNCEVILKPIKISVLKDLIQDCLKGGAIMAAK